ncbi:MAG: universal stress protein, partial [Cyclobacteriaceae bacterium]
MKKILVPTDYSDLSEYALNLANVIARYTKAQIYALKVVSVPGEALFDKKGEVIDSG